jgi:hypothetical protein
MAAAPITRILRPVDYDIISDHYGFNTENVAVIEDKMARKMCRCIKKVQKSLRIRPEITREKAAIAICNNSIFINRGLKFNKITCKKRARFIANKNRWKMAKTRRNLDFKKKK